MSAASGSAYISHLKCREFRNEGDADASEALLHGVHVTRHALSHFWGQTSHLGGRSVRVASPFSLPSATIPPLEDILLMTHRQGTGKGTRGGLPHPARPAWPEFL